MLDIVNPSFLLAGLVILALTSIYLLYLHLTKSNDINGLTGTVKALINQNRKRDEVINFLLTRIEEQAHNVEKPDVPAEYNTPNEPNTSDDATCQYVNLSNLVHDELNNMDIMDNLENLNDMDTFECDDKHNDDDGDDKHNGGDGDDKHSGDSDDGDDYGNDLLDEVIRMSELHLVADNDNANDDVDDVDDEHNNDDCDEAANGVEDDEATGDFEDNEEEEDEANDESNLKDGDDKKQYNIHVTKNKQRLSGLTVNQLRKAAAERNITLHGTSKTKIVNDLYAAL